MPDFKQTFQEEVRRLARKELKALDEKINEQRKTINALLKRISELEKKQAAPAAAPAAPGKQADAPAQDSKGRKARFSPKSIVKFRKKYAISQKALAMLLDVTPFTVSHWEIGKNRPRPVQIEAFSALTKLGKRKLLALVAEKAPGELPAPKAKAPAKKNAAAPAKRGRKAAAKKAAAPSAEKKAAPAAAKKASAPAVPAKAAKAN